MIRDELIPAIKALSGQNLNRISPTSAPAPSIAPPVRSALKGPVEVVAIGTSTGGPNALAEVFAGFPAHFSVPIVIVQHMPPMFTRLLSERLSAQSKVKVEEGRSGGLLFPGHAWIAPGDYHMVVVRTADQVRDFVHQDQPENSCRPAVDVLFRSVAKTFGPTALAVAFDWHGTGWIARLRSHPGGRRPSLGTG